MWIEELPNGKFKYFERYKDPLTEKWKKVSITLEKCNRLFSNKTNFQQPEKSRLFFVGLALYRVH